MDRILGGLTAEQLDQFAQYASQLAGQARAPMTEGHRQGSAISAATSAVTQYQNPGDLPDQIGEGCVGTDCHGEKGERKRKRDSNTPKKERAPPSLRDVSFRYRRQKMKTNGGAFVTFRILFPVKTLRTNRLHPLLFQLWNSRRDSLIELAIYPI
jgi:hypothetical protein